MDKLLHSLSFHCILAVDIDDDDWHKSSESDVAELDPLVGHDGEQYRSVHNHHRDRHCHDLQLERVLVGEQYDQEDGGSKCKCVEDQEDVKGHQVGGVDCVARVVPLVILPHPTRRVDPGLEGVRSIRVATSKSMLRMSVWAGSHRMLLNELLLGLSCLLAVSSKYIEREKDRLQC